MSNNYEYEYDERYCYPNTDVLINKLNITNNKELNIAEREITSIRIANAKINIIKGSFDFSHYKKIHEYIFSDIYEWAGKYSIDFSYVTKKEMIEASIASFQTDYSKMNLLFNRITTKTNR